MKQLRFSSFRQRLNAAFLAVSLVPLLPGRSPVLLQGVLPPDLPDRLPGVLPLDQSPEVLPESASLPVLSY